MRFIKIQDFRNHNFLFIRSLDHQIRWGNSHRLTNINKKHQNYLILCDDFGENKIHLSFNLNINEQNQRST